MSATQHPIYSRELPPIADLEGYSLSRLQAFVQRLDDEVGLLSEECRVFSSALDEHRQRERDSQAAAVMLDATTDDGASGYAYGSAGRNPKSTPGKKALFPHKTDPKTSRLSLEEKNSLAAAELERLKAERSRKERSLEDARELFRAGLEEGHARSKELRMELAYFKREVSGDRDGIVSAERVLKYLEERPREMRRHIEKTQIKVGQIQNQIGKQQRQLRQREDVGENFHEIDFSQLQIENQQFTEHIEQKNAELVELKGTTTRTVQALNSLTDRLNSLTQEQHTLEKELRVREDHERKLRREIEQVHKEGASAQGKNTALKIQHESVKVPKVEEYIAQKAEAHELQKAVQNWRRKVEIATGHVAVMKQQAVARRKALRSVGATM